MLPNTHCLAALHVRDHVSLGLLRSVDTRLRALDRERERVHDAERPADDLALHETHDFVRATGAGVDDLNGEEIRACVE